MKKYIEFIKENIVFVSIAVYTLAIITMQLPYTSYFGFIPYNPWLYLIIGTIDLILISSVHLISFLLWKRLNKDKIILELISGRIGIVINAILLLVLLSLIYESIYDGFSLLSVMTTLWTYALINMFSIIQYNQYKTTKDKSDLLKTLPSLISVEIKKMKDRLTEIILLFDEADSKFDEKELDELLKIILRIMNVSNKKLYIQTVDFKIEYSRQILNRINTANEGSLGWITDFIASDEVDKMNNIFYQIETIKNLDIKGLFFSALMMLILLTQFTSVIVNDFILRDATIIYNNENSVNVEIITLAGGSIYYIDENDNHLVMNSSDIKEIKFQYHGLRIY